MIRQEVLLWASLALLICMAFVLMPSYERFKNAEGQEVDVDPNAPATPAWLKPVEEFLNMFGSGREGLDVDPRPMPGSADAFDPNNPNTYPNPPRCMADPTSCADFISYCNSNPKTPSCSAGWNSGQMPISGMCKNALEGGMTSASTYCTAAKGWAEGSKSPMDNINDIINGTAPPGGVAPASSVSSSIPSGVSTLPSQSMPPPPGEDASGLPPSGTRVIDQTLPAPDYFGGGPAGTRGEDKYVLKSALQPCACPTAGGEGRGSKVPGGMDSWPPTGDEAMKRPNSIAFGDDKNEPSGYLNSFSAFMK